MYFPEKHQIQMHEIADEEEHKKIASFDHPQNIRVGQAKVIYVPERFLHPAHWALPGRGMTSDYARAHEVCSRMNWLMGGAKPLPAGGV